MEKYRRIELLGQSECALQSLIDPVELLINLVVPICSPTNDLRQMISPHLYKY